MTGLYEDVRYGLRALARHRGLTSVAVLSLALGIGANTTIFTMVHAILMHTLPVRDVSRLVAVYTIDPKMPGLWGLSYPNYIDYRKQNPAFSSLLLYTGVTLNLTNGAQPRLVMGQIATANYFSTIGVAPALGRTFTPEEDSSPGSAPVAVISYKFWQSEFGGDPQVTSRPLNLNGMAYTIVGVTPKGFEGLDTLTATDIWLPLMMYPQVFGARDLVNQRQALLFSSVARLNPGITQAQAEAALLPLTHELEVRYPLENAGRRLVLAALTEAAIPPANRGQISDAGTVLMIVSGLVLVIACGNVASLLLARAAGRHKEITVRLALGASRWRLMRQLLIESVMLSLAGGIAGLMVANWVRSALWSVRPPTFLHAAVHLELDRTVLLYNLAVSVATGVLFGLMPALRASRGDLATDLKERSGTPASSAGRWNARALLVMGQVAFSVVTLVGAGLFVRSLRNAVQFDPGFDAAHLGIVVFDLQGKGYDQPRGREFERLATERAAGVPGVISATVGKDWPFHVSLQRTLLSPDGGEQPILAGFLMPGYLSAIGIPLERGREFSTQDEHDGPHVVIINEAAANACCRGEDPVGKLIRFKNDPKPAQIVGVARNANYQKIGENPQPMVYMSLTQYYFPDGTLYVRTHGPPDAVLATVGREIQALDRNLLLQVEPVHVTLSQTLWQQKLSAGLLSLFGGLALILAAIGIYGIVSYSVTQRVREFGVRMALGATGGDVQRMLLVEGVRLVAIGVLVGTIVALGVSQSVKSMLFTVGPRDALTFILVPAILTLVAILACWVPALRATRIDPAIALRDE